MPITGPSSYPPTLVAFLSHWETANATVSGGSVVLGDGTDRAALTTLQSTLDSARDSVTDASVDLAVARGALQQLLASLQVRAVEFNARVRGDLTATPLPAALPEAFAIGQGESIVRENLRKMSRVWDKVLQLGSSTPPGVEQPYVLNGGYTRAQLDADRDALRDAYRAVSDAEVDAAIARGVRNKVQVEIYEKLKAYRKKITGLASAHPELVETLPTITPPEGHTPDPVAIQVVWDATALKARITWSESTDPMLLRYEARSSAGDSYNPEDEIVIAQILPGALREVLSDFSLTSPGLTSGFKIYVILTTGNERGSEAAYVLRPV